MGDFMEKITSMNNNRIVMYSKLNTKKYRDEYNLFLLENYKLVKEALITAGREDLIGFDKKCLIRPEKGAPPQKRFTPHSTPRKKHKK